VKYIELRVMKVVLLEL